EHVIGTDSQLQLSLDLGTTTVLYERQRQRALHQLDHHLDGPTLMISATEHSSQWRNRTAARPRLSTVIREAIVPQRVLRATTPKRGSKRRRLTAKRHRAEIKRIRRRPPIE